MPSNLITVIYWRNCKRKKEIEDFRNQSMTEFQNMANKIMEEKSLKFTQTNKDNIENLLKPLGENLDSFKKK